MIFFAEVREESGFLDMSFSIGTLRHKEDTLPVDGKRGDKILDDFYDIFG
jgi:hypothetical protein